MNRPLAPGDAAVISIDCRQILFAGTPADCEAFIASRPDLFQQTGARSFIRCEYFPLAPGDRPTIAASAT